MNYKVSDILAGWITTALSRGSPPKRTLLHSIAEKAKVLPTFSSVSQSIIGLRHCLVKLGYHYHLWHDSPFMSNSLP
jgi:hypothetical protein